MGKGFIPCGGVDFCGLRLDFQKGEAFVYPDIFFALGVLLFSGVIDVYKSTAVSSEKAEITGTISTEIASKNEHSYYFIIDNVTIDGEETGKQAFVVSGFLPNARAGDKVKNRRRRQHVRYGFPRFYELRCARHEILR
ncbi:MAG: hypothetical protein L6V85_10130 [Clostridiales bacterium]|nr:MAG: hypothetical protein L6V85_10130 [Clostridiales bacterium]